MRRTLHMLLLTGAASALAACGGGGGGGGGGVASIPSPTGVIPPAHIGLVSSAPFAVQAVSGQSPVDVQFSYNSSTNTYEIALPGFEAGRLTNIAYNGAVGQVATSSFSQVTAGASNTLQSVHVFLPVPGTSFSPLTYTSFGEWDAGVFAYGIPTAPSEIPITGSATYGAQIHGSTNLVPDFLVTGAVNLVFDFGAGTLSGFMHPEIIDGFNGVFIDFGQYDFTQTVYSTGSTTFSGKFIVPGLPGADSSFNGNFTGPNAAELMARFQAPLLLSGQQGWVAGVWTGKKCC